MAHAHSPSTEAAVAAVRETAGRHERPVRVRRATGAERPAAHRAAGALLTAGAGAVPTDGDEVLISLAGSPEVEIRLVSGGIAHVTVDGITFHDLPWVRVPIFLGAVFTGTAFVKVRVFPPGRWLIVPLPGDIAYKELITLPTVTPWLARVIGSSP